jgi:hypothetical protein
MDDELKRHDVVPDAPKTAEELQKDQRNAFVNDLVRMLAREPWDQTEVKRLYTAIAGRIVHKTCHECGKLKPQMDGMMVWLPNGKNQVFNCKECVYS